MSNTATMSSTVPPPAESPAGRSRPFTRLVWRWRWLAYAIVGIAVLVAMFGPAMLTQDPLAQDFALRNQAPGAAHWLGTDSFGRDTAARLVAGTRLTLVVSVIATLLALAGGAGLGLAGCVIGGPARTLVYAGFDIVRTMPPILLSLALMVSLGIGTRSVMVAVGVAYMPLFAYVCRATYEREMASGYVAAARVVGAGPWAIAGRHVLPNMLGAVLTQVAIVLPRAVVTESVLSFFGLGASPEIPTWGRIISSAVAFAEQAPASLLFPVLALATLTLGLAVTGDRLRQRFDPLRADRRADH